MLENFKPQDVRNMFCWAEVVNNNDTDHPDGIQRRRLKVRASQIHGDLITDDQLPWATCCQYLGIGGAGTGDVAIPRVGSKVLVLFQQGDPNNPVYLGGIVDNASVSDTFKENYPDRTGFTLPGPGNTTLYIDMKTGDMHLEHGKTTFDVDKDGNLKVNVVGGTDFTSANPINFKTETMNFDVQNMNLKGTQVKVVGGEVDVDGIKVKGHGHISTPPGNRTTNSVV